MDFNGLTLGYSLEGSSNYVAWKDHMEVVVVLEDNVLKEFIDNDIPKPTTSNARDLSEWNKCVAKARRIILEGVRDHIISNLHGKETSYSMWKTMKNVFQNSSDHKKLTLKDKLRNIKMQRNETIPEYLSMFVQCHDELCQVGVTIAKDDLVSLAFIGLAKSWHNYQDSMKKREKLPNWEGLWSNLVHEKIRRNTKYGTSSKE